MPSASIGARTGRFPPDQGADHSGRDSLFGVELKPFGDGVLDAQNSQFSEGGFATAAIEALVISRGFSNDPEPLRTPLG